MNTGQSETILFRNKYRIQSTRLKGWDYSHDGCYFVTLCVKDRDCVFGQVSDGGMILSEIGAAAYSCWMAIPRHFPFVELDQHVVMPNHVHGIIIINKNDTNVETQDFASLRYRYRNPNRFGPQSRNLASVIRGYKIGVKERGIQDDVAFEWQPRYYDRIIRNEKELNNVRNYIFNNLLNWRKDSEFVPS